MKDLDHKVILPAHWCSATIFASPHSGRVYPASFLAKTRLNRREIRSSEDAYVDEFLTDVPAMGSAMIHAGAPRAYVDLNRRRDELDPALIADAPRGPTNVRILSGLGVIPRVVGAGRVIRDGKMSMQEAEARLEEHWDPYHADLAAMMHSAKDMFGQAILIDVHSMPHDARGPGNHPRAQIVLGDRHGASAAPWVTQAAEDAFVCEGFTVARNAPFAGAYIAQSYGKPEQGRHCLQVEIDRSLYLDEQRVTKHMGFARLRTRLTRVWTQLARLGVPRQSALAAE